MMAGLDRTRFVNLTKMEEEVLTCGICLGIFVDPIGTPCCLQTYCGFCLKQWLNLYNTCPNDRKVLNEIDLITAPRVIVNILNKLRVTCDFRDNGCVETFLMENLDHHSKNCLFKPENICAVCNVKNGDKIAHNCCENLIEKLKSVEMSNQNLAQKYECLECDNNLLNEENLNLVEENQTKTQEIERLKNFIKNIGQQISVFEDNKQLINNKISNITPISSNSGFPQTRSYLRRKMGKFSTTFNKQCSNTLIVRDMPWRIVCQIDKKSNSFRFYLRCEEITKINWSLNVSASMRVASQKEGVKHFVRKFRQLFSNANPEHGFPKFMPLKILLEPTNGYILNDTVILEVLFKIETNH